MISEYRKFVSPKGAIWHKESIQDRNRNALQVDKHFQN